MRKIIFVPTWKCQLACPYCDYTTRDREGRDGYTVKAFHKEFDIPQELSWYMWVKYLERFEPCLLEMTGGEPTMCGDLDKLLAHLNVNSKWAITSNSLNGTMIGKLPYHNCLAWTASYHFHSRDLFIANLRYIRSQGVNVRVTLVFTPENHKECMKAAIDFSTMFGINLHPVLKQGFSWEAHRDIFDDFMSISDDKRIRFIGNIKDKWEPDRFETCTAGDDYFALMPDGSVKRCYSHILTDEKTFIGGYEPNGDRRPCATDCCFPCDKEIANRK